MEKVDISGSPLFCEGAFGWAHVVAHRLLDVGRPEEGHRVLGAWLAAHEGAGSVAVARKTNCLSLFRRRRVGGLKTLRSSPISVLREDAVPFFVTFRQPNRMENTPTTKACNVRREYIMKSKRIGPVAAPFLFLVLASTALAGLPDPGMQVDAKTALVITDPQNDFLSPKGVTWGVVGESVTANKTVPNIETLLKTAKAHNVPVFVSPHYYYPTDDGWQFGGAVETMMHGINMFERKGALNLKGFNNSGADWLARYKKYIKDGKTVVVSPHKVYGPQSNDLVLQLRKRGIERVILAGMSANLCVESHLRELLEQGFEVAVVKDATAAAIVPEGDGYAAALTNFRFLASAVWTTNEAKAAMQKALASK